MSAGVPVSVLVASSPALAACTGLTGNPAANNVIECSGPTAPTFNSNEGDDSITIDGVTNGPLTFDPSDPDSGYGNLANGRTLMTGTGEDTLYLSGTINFGAGDLLVSGNNGDSGADIINIDDGTTLTFDAGYGVDLGNSDDTINLSGSATVDGFFDMADGADTLDAAGSTLTVGIPDSGDPEDATFSAGGGDDFINLSALNVGGYDTDGNNQLVSVFVGAGDDVLKLGGGTLAGGISGFSGSDYIELGGVTVNGNVGLGDGADQLVVTGGTSITGGIGAPGYEDGPDDILITDGIIGYIPVDASEPRTSPSVAQNDSGTVIGGVSIFGGADADTVAIFGGNVGGEINLADGSDTLIIDAGADEYSGVTDTDGVAATAYQAPLIPVELGGDGIARVAVTGTSIADTPIIFNGGGGNDTAEVFDLVNTTDLIFLSVEQANFYGQSFSLDLDDNTDSGYYLKSDGSGVHSTLTQTDGDLDLGGGSLIKVFESNTVTMTDGAVDDSIDVVTLNLQGGSLLYFDADTTTGGYDADASDYFLVNNVILNDDPNPAEPTDQVGVTVNLIGAPSASGSRRLIDDAGSATLDDPGLAATVVASETYGYLNDPSTAARTYWLQEQGDSLYLLWTTNINDATTAGYTGASSEPGPVMAAFGVGLGAGAMAVNTNIADMARGERGHDETCQERPGYDVWADADGATGGFGSSDYSAYSARLGVEADVGRKWVDECGRFLAGAFVYLGSSDLSASDGSSADLATYGGGAYLRFSGENGFYGSFLAHAGIGDVSALNAILGSTADYDGSLYGFAANMGRKFHIDDMTTADIRGYAGWTGFDAGRFTDSQGLDVDGIYAATLVFGAEAGVERQISDDMSAFGRLGVKWTDYTQSTFAGGLDVAADTDYTSATGEIGLTRQFGDRAELSLSAFGEAGRDVSLFGGRIRLKARF